MSRRWKGYLRILLPATLSIVVGVAVLAYGGPGIIGLALLGLGFAAFIVAAIYYEYLA